MPFDTEDHKKRQLIIEHAHLKWPDEKNINKLLEAGANDLGLTLKKLTSKTASHLPTPEESARENPGTKFSLVCPRCGKKTYVLRDLCRSCKDSEHGKYKSKLECYECGHKEISEKPVIMWLQESETDFKMQTKKSLGIETITDKEV